MTAASLVRRIPDEQLLRAARDGDRTAWRDLVDRYAETVWDLAERLVGAQLAQDASHVVWLRLAAALPSFDGARTSLWLHRAVWDECSRHRTPPAAAG